MQEAFRRAVEKNPNSPVVPKIKRANTIQAVERVRERRERQFAQVKQQYYDVGLMWFGTKVDKPTGRFYRYDRIPIEQKREKWAQALTSLNEKPAEQRIALLSELASGMQLTGDNANSADNSKYGRFFLFSAFDNLIAKPFGIKFTQSSIFFMEGISDMSGHSEEQKQEFREFMVREAGLKGRVGLPQLFPGISQWLDHK